MGWHLLLAGYVLFVCVPGMFLLTLLIGFRILDQMQQDRDELRRGKR